MTLEFMLELIEENCEDICEQLDDSQLEQLKTRLRACAGFASQRQTCDATDDLYAFCKSSTFLWEVLQSVSAPRIKPGDKFRDSEAKTYINELIKAVEKQQKAARESKDKK